MKQFIKVVQVMQDVLENKYDKFGLSNAYQINYFYRVKLNVR